MSDGQEQDTQRVLACGSRGWRQEDAYIVEHHLGMLPDGTEVLHGGCPEGADVLIDRFARKRGLPVRVFPGKPGKYLYRNRQMLDERPSEVLAFWDGKSRGTKYVIDRAVERNIPVRVYRA